MKTQEEEALKEQNWKDELIVCGQVDWSEKKEAISTEEETLKTDCII